MFAQATVTAIIAFPILVALATLGGLRLEWAGGLMMAELILIYLIVEWPPA